MAKETKKVNVDLEAKFAMLEVLWLERLERIAKEEHDAEQIAKMRQAFKSPEKCNLYEDKAEMKNKIEKK